VADPQGDQEKVNLTFEGRRVVVLPLSHFSSSISRRSPFVQFYWQSYCSVDYYSHTILILYSYHIYTILPLFSYLLLSIVVVTDVYTVKLVV